MCLIVDSGIVSEKSRDRIGLRWDLRENDARLAMHWPAYIINETLDQSLLQTNKLHIALVWADEEAV